MTSMRSEAFESLTIDGVVAYWAEKTPDAPAIQFERGEFLNVVLSWRALEGQIQERAAKLHGAGIRHGDNVALVLEDTPSCHVCIYALMRIGAVLVPIDPMWGTEVVRSIRETTGFRWMLCVTSEMVSKFDYIPEARFVDALVPAAPGEEGPRRSSLQDHALIAFTSGTISAPKGVPLTHANLRAAYRSGVNCLPLSDASKPFACVFRLSGLGVLGVHYFLANEIGANTLVLPMLGANNCRNFWQELQRYSPGFLYLVPTLVKLLNHYSIPLQDPIQGLVSVTSAGPIPKDTFDYFQKRFGQRLLNIYGLTELSFAVFFGFSVSETEGSHSIGPARGVEAKLIDLEGNLVTSAEGSGELYLRGPMLASGYYRNPSATEATFVDGWLKTGDLTVRDAKGNYSITGRAKDVVIRGGFNIALAEIDEVIVKHPGVVDSCSFGVPDAIAGEELMCLVHLREGANPTEAELKEWVSVHAGAYKAPRRVLFIREELPRNGAGKLLRNAAKTLVAGMLAQTHV